MTTARARSSDSPGGERDHSPERHRSGGPRRSVGPVAPSLQMKPAVVGAAGDAFEKEADHAAQKVVQGKAAAEELSPVSPQALQRLAQVPAVSEDDVKEGGGVAQALFDEEEEPVAATSTHADTATDTDTGPAQAKAIDSSGPRAVDVPRPGVGTPLAPETKGRLESGLGADLGGVRVHDDAAARSTADSMGAKAFTQGSDISLGSGQSADDLGLMAHEAAHVVQQAGGSGSVAQRDRTTGSTTAPAAAPAAGLPEVTQKAWPDGSAIDTTTTPKKTVKLATLRVPATKKKATEAKLPTGVEIGLPRDTNQSAKWKKDLKSSAQDAATKVLAKPEVAATKDADGNFYLVNDKAAKQPVIVTSESLGDLALRPTWDREGVPTRFHVDHRVEYQLGGLDDETNYWLLEEQANMSSGSTIANQLASSLNAVFHKAKTEGVANIPADVASARGGGWAYTIGAISKDPLPVEGRENSNWDYQDVKDGKPVLDHLRAMTDAEMDKAGGTAEKLVLFMGPMGGQRSEIEWGTQAPGGVKKMNDWWFHLGSKEAGKANNNVGLTELSFTPGKGGGGTAKGVLFKEDKKNKSVINEIKKDLKIETRERIPWAGFLDKQKFLNEARTELSFKKLSPIELEEMDLAPGKGLVARGRLLPTVPLIAKAAVDVVIDGDDVYLSKIFTADDFTFPGPIKVGVCSLELRFGLKGFQILGEANFEVQGLGSGRVYAAAGASLDDVSFALGGEFNFLADLFEPARVELWYKDNELGGKGVLGVKEGKVKGLKSAQVTAEFGKEGFKANGTFATTIPGVESGTLAFAYKEDGTVELGGTLSLGSKVPGISSGSVEAQLVRNPEGGWKVSGKIKAVPSIPGVASEITGTYDDGAIQVEATVAYARGMAAGQFTIGLSNKPIDPASGKPGGEPGKDLAAYGGGQVALTLAPWLKATAGLKLLPTGEIEVSGEIGLPAALEIFPRKSLDKELFKVGIDIPIIGISVAGQNVGIFATIAGGAQLQAFFGPAELKDLRLGITWNPDHQENTTVKGHAALALPAGAGIRLSISAALGAGIPIVSARLGLEIGGLLGIEASIGADVDINWTPAAGLVIDAVAKASAEPVFKFDITGFARVDLDLLLKTINLYEKKWQLAAFEYGSGLKLGVSLPVHYQEGKPFEPSLSDVTFEVPTIDPKALLSGLVEKVT